MTESLVQPDNAPVDWDAFRNMMPVAERFAYFDHAAVAPLPRPTSDAIGLWLKQNSESGDLHWLEWEALVEATRASAARMISANVDEIALLGSTSDGINLVADGYPWAEGDNVVILADEFPSNQYPWLFLEYRGVETRRVPTHDGVPDYDEIFAACDDRTRIISISWVSFSSGWRNDLAKLTEMAHDRGILLFVDAIQGLGVFPLDVSEIPIDFLAADGHKWMMGPEGAGFCFIRRKHLDLLNPVRIGWSSVANAGDFQNISPVLKDSAARFETGSKNMAGLIGFGASLEFLDSVDIHERSERVLQLTGYACERLQQVGARILTPRIEGHTSGILIFDMPNDSPQELRKRCIAEQIVLSCRGGGLRISPHAYNNEEDIERLCSVLA